MYKKFNYKVRLRSGLFSLFILIIVILILPPGKAKAQFELIGSCEVPDGAEFIEIQGDYAYVTDWNGSLCIIDISQPREPHLDANYDLLNYSWGISSNSGNLFIAGSTDGLFIYDLSDPLDPELAGTFDGLWAEHAVVAHEDVAYLENCEHFYILDISEISEPVEIGGLEINTIESTSLFVDGDYAYVTADYDHELHIIDMTDPANPVLRGICGDLQFWGAFSISFLVRNGYAYIASSSAIQIIDVTDPDDPYLARNYGVQYAVSSMDHADNLMFTADMHGVLKVLDLADPLHPQVVDQYDSDYYAYNNIVYRDGLLYALKSSRLDILSYGSTATGREVGTPKRIFALDSYPNPFNSSTIINYELTERSKIQVKIYNIVGQKMTTLFDGVVEAGYHSIIWDASTLPSGVYFARLEMEGQAESVKMVLLK